MSYKKNVFQNLMETIFSVFRLDIDGDVYGDLSAITQTKYDDDVIECLQFGICDFRSKTLPDIPYFHF